MFEAEVTFLNGHCRHYRHSRFSRTLAQRLSVLVLLLAVAIITTSCGTAAQAAGAQNLNLSGNLPGATVNESYNAVLAVGGGNSPYHFSVTTGALPVGISLNSATGTFSGKPAAAGNFSFEVIVTDSTNLNQGNKTFVIDVGDSTGGNIKVSVSPASATLFSKQKQQFTATVSGTSNTGVTWSATAGSVDASGLYVAPAVNVQTSVVVTATSKADSSKSASAAATVEANSGPALTITTKSVPEGTTGTTYTATVTGSGGSQPYDWSVVSGSLPAGLQLGAQTGTISGLTTKSGSYVFSVKITDASGNTTTEALTLTMNTQQSGNCGPPLYSCSRSDLDVIVPTSPPVLSANPAYYGGHLGAGLVAVDPAYNNRILRVTDGETDSTRPGESYSTGSSAEKNVTSFDESLFFVHNETGEICLFQFEPSSFSAKFHGCFRNIGSGFDFGYTAADAHAFYSYYREKLYRFVIDTTNWTIVPDPAFNNGVGFFDPDNANCLNGQIAKNHLYVGDSALSSDDSTLIAAVGPQQNADPYFVVWSATKGCQWMNVETWQVSRGWNTGLSNPVAISWKSGNTPTKPGGIHNAQIDRSGAFGVLTVHQVPSLVHKLFWTIGTNQVDDTCTHCMSHWASDFGVSFWDMGYKANTGYNLVSQQIGTLSPVPNTDTSAVQGQWGNDVHMSHANAEQGQKLIYLASYQPGKGGAVVTQVWEDEIVGANWDGTQRTIRFNKNWATAYGGFNSTARCSISRQGTYAICGSDYQMYNLDRGFGNGENHDTCDHKLSSGHKGTNGCRIDVLLFELR